MSKCIIFYVSQHHQNTEKLLKQAIGGDPPRRTGSPD